jgi:hypothetical protein
VVVDVTLSIVLFVRILVRLVGVRQRRVVVLVFMGGDQVRDFLLRPVVVAYVHVLVLMHHIRVIVCIRHAASPFLQPLDPLEACFRRPSLECIPAGDSGQEQRFES